MSSIGDARLEMDDVNATPAEEAHASAPAAVVLWAPWRSDIEAECARMGVPERPGDDG